MTDPGLHHVAVAVEDIDAALPFYRDRLGLRLVGTREVAEDNVRIAFLSLGDTLLELVQPLDEESGVARFLRDRGRATLHHVCFAVDDLGALLRRLEAAGIELIDHEPRRGAEGEVAFLHPRAGSGVLVELIDRATVSTR
jgi:methylmalonyl-CoA/ethylmalonyl-CoA epimerase